MQASDKKKILTYIKHSQQKYIITHIFGLRKHMLQQNDIMKGY